MLNRRQVLGGAAIAAGAMALPSALAQPAAASPAGTLFGLGVASGDPLPHSVILWTRLLGAVPGRPVEVAWQVALDDGFRHVVRSGTKTAKPQLAHSVHVDPNGLLPGHEYFYRFKALGQISPVGRTRTAPWPWQMPNRLRFGIVNCQDFQNGYWPAYDGLAAEDLDLVLHLAITSMNTIRTAGSPTATTPRRKRLGWTSCRH